MEVVPKLVLTVPASIGAEPPGQGPRSFRSKPWLESARGGSAENGQGPVESIHFDQMSLPPLNVVPSVAVQRQGTGVFVVAVAALGGEIIRLLVEEPVFITDAPFCRLSLVQVRFDPCDFDQLRDLLLDPSPQVSMLVDRS